MRRVLTIIGSLLVLSITSLIAAQSAQLSSKASVVPIYARVVGADGKPVLGLTRDDFAVFDNGRPAELTSFAADGGPMAIEVIAEIASVNSMLASAATNGGTPLEHSAALQTLESSGQGLADRLRPGDSLSFMNTGEVEPNRGAKRGCGCRPRRRRHLPPTNHRGRLCGTVFGRLALTSKSTTRRVMVIVAGESGKAESIRRTLESLHAGPRVGLPSKHTEGDVSRELARQGVTVSVLTFDGWVVDQEHQVKGLAENSGGTFLRQHNVTDVGAALRQLSDEAHEAYILGISPAALDDTTHKLEVRVNGRPVRVFARNSYVARVSAECVSLGTENLVRDR